MSEYERYLIDSGDNDITPEQERWADKLAAENRAIERAYGLLWRDHSSRNSLVIEARLQLLTALDREGQRRGIEYAISLYGPVTDTEIALMDEPLTDVQRSVRDGTFGVRSA